MIINFTKREVNDHVIACERMDGSVTWMRSSEFFVVHDLCHYAVEILLGLRNAFYGMLALGISISDFELPKGKRNFELTEEALFAEHLVNLLVIDLSQGRINDLAGELKKSYGNGNLIERLNDEKIEKVRTLFKQLVAQWKDLEKGESMELEFKN